MLLALLPMLFKLFDITPGYGETIDVKHFSLFET